MPSHVRALDLFDSVGAPTAETSHAPRARFVARNLPEFAAVVPEIAAFGPDEIANDAANAGTDRCTCPAAHRTTGRGTYCGSDARAHGGADKRVALFRRCGRTAGKKYRHAYCCYEPAHNTPQEALLFIEHSPGKDSQEKARIQIEFGEFRLGRRIYVRK
jgi:hypothetical protein